MLKIRPKSYASKPGFTIVELLIIAPIVILTIGAFITVIVSMTGEVLASRSSNTLAYSIQNTLNRIESDAKSSTTFLEASNITLTSPQGYDDATGSFANVGANGNMLIMNTFTTTGNPSSAASGLVYLTGQPNDCTSPQQNTPMMMNVIYFVKNSKLWRRSIVTSDYLTAGCTAPWQQPSCTTPTGFCKTQDELMIDGINASDFVVQYFATSGATTADSVASDTGANDTDRHNALKADSTVGVSISVTKTTAGRDIAQSGTIRATGDGGALPIVPAPTGSQTFAYTDASQTFMVPAGVTSLTVDLYGASGGDSNGNLGGKGGRSQGNLAVTSGEVLTIIAPGAGGTVTTGGVGGIGGYGGGARGGTTTTNTGGGGGGGGAQILRTGTPLVIAGGGGGASPFLAVGGIGGGSSGGPGGAYDITQNTAATGGTQSAGGATSTGPGVTKAGQPGSYLQGGQAGDENTANGGGGGGGGYYGGGAGGTGYYATGGGGGSGYIGGVTSSSMTSGVQSGNGQVIISW